MPIIEGIVEHGDARGRELGFPTANIPFEDRDDLDGVWAGTVRLPDGELVITTVSVGRRPTFYGPEGPSLVEAYLLDFSGDLYGQNLVVNLMYFMRDQVAYSGTEALIDQLYQDIDFTRRWAVNEGIEATWKGAEVTGGGSL